MQAHEEAYRALNTLTDEVANPGHDIGSHPHRSVKHPISHALLSKHDSDFNPLEDIQASWHMGNYVKDRQTGRRIWEPMSVYVRLLKEHTEKTGRQYDDPKSQGHIVPFIRAFKLEQTLQELEQPDINQYSNFNAFFSRALKANARPIAEPTNDLVFTSPADCRMTAFSTTDLATKYWIKGHGFTIGKLLGGDHWASTFGGGSMTIARLAPQDYHHWHAPTSGKVAARFEIPGTYYTVNPQAINEAGTLNVFCENRRSIMCLQRPNGTYVAVVAVGAMLVGSIIYEAGVEAGTMVQRGQCLGRFQYGGSTVIVLWPPGEVALDEDLAASSGAGEPCEILMRVGWKMGVAPTKGRVGRL